jgi:hypothetical protein
MSLALELGEEDADALAERLTVDQVREWWAFYALRPWGDEWRRSGRMVTLLATAAGAKLDAGFEDKFLPTYAGEEPPRPQSQEEMLAELRKVPAFAAQLAAREGDA